jgi:hypothetical protein
MAVTVLLCAAVVCLASCRGPERPPEPDPLIRVNLVKSQRTPTFLGTVLPFTRA